MEGEYNDNIYATISTDDNITHTQINVCLRISPLMYVLHQLQRDYLRAFILEYQFNLPPQLFFIACKFFAVIEDTLCWGWYYLIPAVLKAVFIWSYFAWSRNVRKKCTSIIEIIRVITAIQFAPLMFDAGRCRCWVGGKWQIIIWLGAHTVHQLSRVFLTHILSLSLNPSTKDPTQNLRSALADKARKQQPPPPSSTKPKRKMKPGQAKTISDLPQLSAWG